MYISYLQAAPCETQCPVSDFGLVHQKKEQLEQRVELSGMLGIYSRPSSVVNDHLEATTHLQSPDCLRLCPDPR